MNAAKLMKCQRGFLLTELTLALLCGCGKPATQAPAASAPATETTQTAAAPAPAAVTPTVAPDTGLAQARSALKTRDYETATDTLLALQQSKHLTDQQAADVAGQMRQLQSALVNAVSSGDPKAKAAAEKLRHASLHQ